VVVIVVVAVVIAVVIGVVVVNLCCTQYNSFIV
jgi:hypothetical protein